MKILIFVSFGLAILSQLAFYSSAQDLRVGFSKKDITPLQKNITLGGYGTYFGSKNSTRRSGGVHDPLCASAISFYDSSNAQQLSIVSIDAVGLSPAIVKRVKKRLAANGHENLNLLISATHTHAAPDVLGLWGNLPFSGIDEDYLEYLENQITAAIIESIEGMIKVKIFRSGGHVINKSSLVSQTSRLFNFWFYDGDRLVGTVSHWSAHPTMLAADNNYISAGYVGSYRYEMEKRYGGVHIFLNGLLGGVFPLGETVAGRDPFLTPGADIYDLDVNINEYLKMVGVGFDLFEQATLGRQDKIELQQTDLNFKKYSFSVQNENRLFKLALRLKVLEDRGHRYSVIKSQLYSVSLGEQRFIFVPGEITPEAFSQLASVIGDKRSIPVGITNDWLGYILTSAQYHEEEYKYFKALSVSSKLLSSMIGATIF